MEGLYNILHEALQHGCVTEPGGSIVHNLSILAERGYNKAAVFSASKHAAAGMMTSAAIEAGARDIRLNCVLPRVTSLQQVYGRAVLWRLDSFGCILPSEALWTR